MDPAARLQLRLAASLERATNTIVDYVYNSQDYFIPTAVRYPPQLYAMHMHVANCAYAVIQGLIFFHSLRSQHLYAMCREKSGPLYNMHASSIRRLQMWKEQTNPVNPTLAPAAKIPATALGFRLDQRAYDAYVSKYVATLKKFEAIEYKKYCRALNMMKDVASQHLGQTDYQRWLLWYNTTFKSAMEKWHIFLKDLTVPSWEDSVDELYDMVVKSVEESEDKTAEHFAQGICSGQVKIA
jgi:hypothetical protein